MVKNGNIWLFPLVIVAQTGNVNHNPPDDKWYTIQFC